MNLLYLANVVVAEVGGDYYWHWTHDQEIGKALVAAGATVIAALIAIAGVVLTVRKTTQQIELSKQGMPPELTRYKEWLEASERYKEFAKTSDACKSKDHLKEYQDIESSRRVALKRAVWERKVLSACPDVNGQKRLLGISDGVIVNGNKANYIPSFGSSGLTVLGIFFAILLILVAIASIALIVFDLWGNFFGAKGFATGEWDIASIILDILLMLVILWAANHFINIIDAVTMSVTGKYFAEYGYLRIIQDDLSNKEFEDILRNSSNKNSNVQRCIFALWDEKYRNFVYCPGESNSKWSYISGIFKFGLPYKFINRGYKKRGYNYGEYKPEIFGIGREGDANAINGSVNNKKTHRKSRKSRRRK